MHVWNERRSRFYVGKFVKEHNHLPVIYGWHAGAIAQAVFKVTCRAHVVHFHLGIVEEKQQQRTLFMKLVHFFYVKIIICTNQVNRQR